MVKTFIREYDFYYNYNYTIIMLCKYFSDNTKYSITEPGDNNNINNNNNNINY